MKAKTNKKVVDGIFKVIDEINTQTGFEGKKFAKEFVKRTTLKKGSLSSAYFDDFENDNFHTLNGLLYVNGYFDVKFEASHDFFMKEYKHFIVK